MMRVEIHLRRWKLAVSSAGGALGAAAAAAGALAALAAAPLLTEAAARPASSLEARAGEAAKRITADSMREWTRRLASDEMEGRAPGSRGDALARRYIVEQMKALGLEPGGLGGSWEQTFEMVGITAEAPAVWTFRAGEREVGLANRDEFIAFSGVQEPVARVAGAEVVFVGYGIEAPEYGWDDYKGVDVAGKVLLMMNNDPEWDPALFAGSTRLYYGRWDYKYQIAAEKGAAGAIILHTTPSAGYPYQVVQTSWSGEQFELPAGGEPRVQLKAWTTEEATRKLVGLAGKHLDQLVSAARSRDFRPLPLGVRTSIELATRVRRGVQTANVLGLLRGRDPELRGEYVVCSAHHDHLGVGEPDASGDTIYNGALDNASGVAQVLAIAAAFKGLPEPPRRSLLFAFVAAEEQGLLGSEYFAQHPTVPPGRMAANINYDGGNIWGRTADVTYIGYGKSTLDAIVEEFARAQGRTVKSDQFPDRGFFYRSDQFNFARIGVPAIYLDSGTEYIGRPAGWGKEQIEAWEAIHYHQPSDELGDDWSFDGMVDDARLGFLCGLRIAEQEELPAWKPGDEFEAARKRALAEVGPR